MLDFDPASPAFLDDPYPFYDALRSHAPVVRIDRVGGWVVTRHEDVNALLRDTRFSNDRTRSANFAALIPDPVERERRARGLRGSLLSADPPEHTRLRGLVAKAFTPAMIERLRPRVEALVDELVGAIAPGVTVDLVAALASPLPVVVIATMLGVPPEDRPRFAAWSETLATSLDSVITRSPSATAATASGEITQYLGEIAEQRRASPKDDLISALVAVEEKGDRLDHAELLVLCRLLLIAGHETTTSLLAGGIAALAKQPGDLARLADPAVTATAVEEMLRFDPPAQMTVRIALDDTPLRTGEVVKKGEIALAVVAAANRDPEVFTEPNRFDITRAPNPHLAFGHGIHFCLGAPLARLEAQIALRALAARFRSVELAGTPVRRPAMVVRGLTALPVRFG
jgi:cytochrome P450